MRVLVVNTGSSTLKWTLFDGRERTTIDSGAEPWSSNELDRREQQVAATIRAASKFDVVGHRVVHGGTRFTGAVVVDHEVRALLDPLAQLDPTHMRPALAGIDVVRREFPSAIQVAAFDTSFHARMPEAATGYALPFEWSERWGLRRFGYHGLSVAYALERTRAMLERTPRRMIVCHLGGGCSVTALSDGKSVDTTMGFSPLDGVMMATRSGALDPGLVLHLQTNCGVGIGELADALQNRSGLLGVSGVSSDVRQVLQAADAGAPRARLAYDRFVLGLRRAVGSMVGVLEGVDAIVFTGGIGENSERVRVEVASALGFAGLSIDADANRAAADDRVISSSESTVVALVVRAREELVILDDAVRLTSSARWSS